jgi:hypothetical protein
VTHWTDEVADDDADDEPLVRPYTITRGRTTAGRDDLTLITVITAAPRHAPNAPNTPHDPDGPDEGPAPSASGLRGLQPEHRAVLDLCREPRAVAEVAAGLDLPVSVTKILIGDLLDTGLARARPPASFISEDGAPDMEILEAVRNGLRRL